MKVDALNKNHAKYLSAYIKYVQKTIYTSTEEEKEGKFKEINDLLVNVVRFANKFKEESTKEEEINEWCYMIPNLMLYSSVGFLIGIKNKVNSELVNDAIDGLFEGTVKMTAKTSEILEKLNNGDKLEGLLEKYIENVNN